MKVEFRAEEVVISPNNQYYVDVYADVEMSEADDIFDYIKGEVDHDRMMECLDESEVREFFKIEETEDD